jgi:hypothetical protein
MNVTTRSFTPFKPLAIAAALTAASTFQVAEAAEGGISHYVPGLYNDFFMNMQLEPGFHFRDDLIYYGAQFPNGVTLGRNTAVNVDLDMWFTVAKLAWVSDFEILGARYGAGVFCRSSSTPTWAHGWKRDPSCAEGHFPSKARKTRAAWPIWASCRCLSPGNGAMSTSI